MLNSQMKKVLEHLRKLCENERQDILEEVATFVENDLTIFEFLKEMNELQALGENYYFFLFS